MRNLSADEVPKLSDELLREELEVRGTPVGPISDFTRPLLEKILLRKLGLLESGEEEGARGDGWASQAVESKAASDAEALPVYAFFGVHLPPNCCESHGPDPDFKPVYTDKAKCLAALKKHKGSRFKTFPSYDDALQFSMNGPKVNLNESSVDLVCDKVDSVDGNANNQPSLSLEKPCAFRGPSSQDRVKFRKTIETGDIAAFNELVCNNPRYLVSSGDSPAILKEGTRYNALHVACLTNQHEICAMILRFISQPDLFKRLYPDDSPSTSTRRQQYLLDLYLNMPDKGPYETPLHIACKLGHVQCVKILTSYALCDKEICNKYGDKPRDVICQRWRGGAGGSPSNTKAAIAELLEAHYYVPVLRDSSFNLPPVVGEVWSPTIASEHEFAGDVTSSTFSFLNVSDCSLMNVSSLDCSGQLPSTASTSLMHRLALPSPLSCSRKVEAFLGPLPLSKALSARKQWRDCARPSRTLCSIPANRLETSGFGEDSSPIQPNAAVHSTPKRGLGLSLNLETPPSQGTTSILSSTPRHRDVVLPDYEKGLEVHGRRLAKEYNTNWFEYWDFLGEFVDCSSEDGKAKLEAHLKQQFAKVVANEQSIDMDMVCRKLIDEGVDVENKDVVAAAADSESSLDPPFSATSSGRLTAVMIPVTGVSPSNHLPVKSHTQSPNRSSSSSSLGSLCQGLEAIRLNASLSPTASHYSPAAQRRYNELMDMIQSDESQLRELITSIDTSHLSLTADELNLSLRSDNWRLISYVAQSCRVTARTLACVLQDLVADPQLRMLPQLSIIRMVKTRIAGEILALHVLISRCCADDRNTARSKKSGSKHKDGCNVNGENNNSSPDFERENFVESTRENSELNSVVDNNETLAGSREQNAFERSIQESGITFVHGLLAVEILRLVSECLLPSELLSLLHVLKVVVNNLTYLEIALSDEEGDEDDVEENRRLLGRRDTRKIHDRSDHAQHVKCVVLLLERALGIATNEGSDDKCNRIPGVAELPGCSCHWENCCVTLAALTEYAFNGPSSLAKKHSGTMRNNSNNTSMLESSLNQSNVKFNKAHSFLHQTVFGNGSPSIHSRINAKVKGSPELRKCSLKESIVKTLNFDDDDNLSSQDVLNKDCNGNSTPSNLVASKKLSNAKDINLVPMSNLNDESLVYENNNVLLPNVGLLIEEIGVNGVCVNSDTGMENIASDPISPNDDHVDSGHVLDDGCNEDNDDDDDSFATAANTSIGSSLATPEDIKEFYIKGTTPTKVDVDVLKALAGTSSIDVATTAPVDETKYPHLAQWQQLLQDKVRSSSQLELNDTNDAAPVDQGRVSSLFESPYCPKLKRSINFNSSNPSIPFSPLP